MPQVLTVSCKLEVAPYQVKKLDAVLFAFSSCCKYVKEKTPEKQITQARDKYARVRTSLQKKASKGTRSTRRRARQILQRLSGRERRFQSPVNHTISYRLTQYAKKTKQTIALEDLTGIRQRTNQQPGSKTEIPVLNVSRAGKFNEREQPQ